MKERIAELEAYLSAPTGNDQDDTRHWKMYLEHLKKMADEPHKPCHLLSTTSSAEIPFALLMQDLAHPRGFGLDAKLNGRIARLEIDTGAGGLVVKRSVAEHAGLKPFSQMEMGGVGDQGYKPGYSAYVDSIRIGNLEFQDCQVRVTDGGAAIPYADGLIGMDVFSQFLVTLDYPARKLLLGPLPPRPGEATAVAPALKTSDSDQGDSDESGGAEKRAEADKHDAQGAESGGTGVTAGAKATATAQNATSANAAHGPYDRYVAPEMQSYTPVYRVGPWLIPPAALNGETQRLFILDTGAFATSISPQAAREVTKLRTDSHSHVIGMSGNVKDVYSADNITFRFAQLSQKTSDVISFDTSRISRGAGMEISGFLGANTLFQLTTHIDYRDGLVKFDYDPKRLYSF